MALLSHPVLSCEEARRFEQTRFEGDETKEWPAMLAAGAGIAQGILDDFKEFGGLPDAARILILAGKGHNGGDALIAAERIAASHPMILVDVACVGGEGSFKPLAARARRALYHAAPGRIRPVRPGDLSPAYDLVIDGVFGFQFRPPLRGAALDWLKRANACSARMRAAVDLPSGLSEPDAFRADFTYATGLVKAPTLSLSNAGRVRYVDLGFEAAAAFPAATDWVLGQDVLAPLCAARPPSVDKRSYGHLFVVGGSRSYPGAVLMSVLAALRSGVGLVTAFIPETFAPAFAARAPEAMWVGWPETPDGGLAMEGTHLLNARRDQATAWLFGPGLSREPETLAVVKDTVSRIEAPIVLDADALQSDIVHAAKGRMILTPHAGEFARIAGQADLKDFAAKLPATVVLKGPVTRVSDGQKVFHSFFGGPVLARGGSGDLLAGLIGGLLAQGPADPLGAACRGTVWHGRAADELARVQGQVAVQTTHVLDHLAAVLRSRNP